MLSFSLYDASYYVMLIFLNSVESELIKWKIKDVTGEGFVTFGGSGGIEIIS